MTDPRSQPAPADAWPPAYAQPAASPHPPARPFQQDWQANGSRPPQARSPQGQYAPTRAMTAAGPAFAPAAPRYKMTAWRVICGLCWAAWTALFIGGAIAGLAKGNIGTFLVGGVLGGLSAWYDYRIWACKARRLTFFIIF